MMSYKSGVSSAIALAETNLDEVSGGCMGVAVPVRGGVIYVSPTTGFPHPTSTGPTFPSVPWKGSIPA